MAPSIRKSWNQTSPTSGGRSVGIVLSRTQATEFSFCVYHTGRTLGICNPQMSPPSITVCLSTNVVHSIFEAGQCKPFHSGYDNRHMYRIALLGVFHPYFVFCIFQIRISFRTLCVQVAGSIPDEVNLFSNLSRPSNRYTRTSLRWTQPLTEMSTWNLPWG
jgi:hypothetical protein